MKINVLIPMSGRGSRFLETHERPKPLIEIKPNLTMIEFVVQNLNINGKYIFLVLKDHYDKYNLSNILKSLSDNVEIVIVDSVTEGAACTTLLAKELINDDTPLLIANSDQYIDDWNFGDFIYSMSKDNLDGGVVTFRSTHPKWSFAKLDSNGFITEIAEKKPISDLATVGIYYWSKGSDYVKYAEQMIRENIRVNNEFYVAPVYNEAIADCKRFKTFDVKRMMGLGTPEDLNEFLKTHSNV